MVWAGGNGWWCAEAVLEAARTCDLRAASGMLCVSHVCMCLVCWYGDHVYMCVCAGTYVCCNNNNITYLCLYAVASARWEISASAGVDSLTADTPRPRRTQAGAPGGEEAGRGGSDRRAVPSYNFSSLLLQTTFSEQQ